MSIRIIVPGAPIPKARPRMTRVGHVYTPKRTADYEKLIGLKARAAVAAGGETFPEGVPVRATINIALPPPKKHREAPTSKPDIDNYIKAALDGINGIVLHDDSQIVSIHADKVYSEKPRLDMILERVYVPDNI